MNSKKRSGSGIFLMEMIMVCGFFLLCAAVCIQVFLRADSMSRLAREKNQAVLAAESLADAWKAYGLEGLNPVFERRTENRIEVTGGPPLEKEEDLSSPEQPLLVVYWDENWERITEDTQEGCYVAVISEQKTEAPDEGGSLDSLRIEINRDFGHPRWREQTGTLYALELKRYIPEGEGSHGQK